jgi:hypothetical protein
VVVVLDDWSIPVEETTGARSSMQKTSSGKIVAQEHYASRLPRFLARQDYSEADFTPVLGPGRGKMRERSHWPMTGNSHIETTRHQNPASHDKQSIKDSLGKIYPKGYSQPRRPRRVSSLFRQFRLHRTAAWDTNGQGPVATYA